MEICFVFQTFIRTQNAYRYETNIQNLNKFEKQIFTEVFQ